jgi:hypothetical protein
MIRSSLKTKALALILPKSKNMPVNAIASLKVSAPDIKTHHQKVVANTKIIGWER